MIFQVSGETFSNSHLKMKCTAEFNCIFELTVVPQMFGLLVIIVVTLPSTRVGEALSSGQLFFGIFRFYYM